MITSPVSIEHFVRICNLVEDRGTDALFSANVDGVKCDALYDFHYAGDDGFDGSFTVKMATEYLKLMQDMT